MRAQIKIAAVRDAFQLAEFAFLAERKRVLHISRAHRVMRELVLLVITQNQLGGIDPQIRVPLEPAIAPVGVPLEGFFRVTEKLHLHLLELAAAEGEVSGRNLVAETLALLRDTEGYLHAVAIHHVLKIHKHPLCRFRPQKRLIIVIAHRAHVRFKHQVELPRFGERAEFLGVRAQDLGVILHRRQIDNLTVPFQLVGILVFQAKET